MVNTVLKAATTAVKCFCLLHQIHVHIYEFTETRGESMLPTIAPHNDFVHVLKSRRYIRPYSSDNPDGLRVGDCIVLRKPHDSKSRVCKRITGMQGDLILIDPSFNEDYEHTFIEVPKGHVWVTGDNLSYSVDSRSYSAVPMGLIVGKIVAANDFNQPFWKNNKLFGFRWIENNYIDEK